jgi:diaminohydroxyphosphoribosylaminopyrimidine deaminase/5-amino-6-(5-phosphoribosylamino)uracil reductase
VIAKWAMTLDGRIASRAGQSRWITSPEARAFAHRELRGSVDAVVVGAGTVRADDPELTNRAARGRRPLRVVVCGRRPLPPRANVLSGPHPTLLALPEGVPAPRARAEVLRCGKGGRVDLRRLLAALHARGIGRILVEGGGELLGAFFDRDLVDQVCVFVAARVLGGAGAVSPVGGRGRARVADALPLEHATRREVGPDVVVEGYVSRRSRAGRRSSAPTPGR